MSTLQGDIQFRLHARLLGGAVNRVSDLLPASLLSTAFFLAIVPCVYRFWRPPTIEDETIRRPPMLVISALALFSTALAFSIRAAESNTAVPSRGSYVATEIMFVLGHLLLMDSVITLTRDLLLVSLNRMHPSVFFTFLSHVILMTCLALEIAGDIMLPSPDATVVPSSSSSTLRLWSALLQFILLNANIMFYVFFSWVVSGAFPYLPSFFILLALNWSMWPSALCQLTVVAVTLDTEPLATSRAFFYVSFGIFQLITAIIMFSINLNRFFGRPGYGAGGGPFGGYVGFGLPFGPRP